MRLYYDFISPFAYLAHEAAYRIAEKHGRTVEPVPILFAALLNHWGQLGPAEIPPKRVFVFKQCWRRAHDLGVHFAPPPSHPFNPLLGLRVASLPMDEADRRKAVAALFRAVWAGGPGITDATVVAGILDEVGLDGAALVQAAVTPENKARVKETTAAAVEAGVFGVPTIVVDGELFWGGDALVDVDRFLRGEDPVPADAIDRWGALKPSASRR